MQIQKNNLIKESIQKKIRFLKSLNTSLKFVTSSWEESRSIYQFDEAIETGNFFDGVILEDLLKKIVPVLETDYKSLTTNEQQRKSFRSHIVNAVVKTLTPAIANNTAEDKDDDINEVDIDIVDDPVDDKFIDIRTDAEKKAEEEDNQPDER